MSRRSLFDDPRMLGACLVGFATLVWLPSVFGSFVWDDVNNLVSSERLRSWSAFLEVFRHDAMWSAERPQAAIGTYRPIALASFVLDFQLFGRRAMGFHVTSVFWHAMASLALFRAFLKFAPPAAAFGMAALWCAHPVCVEATAWINGRSEVFAVLFGASAMALAGAPRLGPARLLGAGLCLVGALLSKEAGLIFVPVVVWLAGEADGRAGQGWIWRRIHWPMLGAAVLALAGYLAMRHNALDGGVAPGVEFKANSVAALVPIWGRSTVTAFAPIERSLQHLSLWLAELPDAHRWAYRGVVAALALAILGFWWRGRRIAAVGLLWWLGALVPVAIIAVRSWPGYYRWMVIGLPGLIMAGYFGLRGVVDRRIGAFVASALLVGAVALTERAIPVWRTGGALFGAMVEEQPHIGYGYVGLGAWLLEVGDAAEAEKVLRKGTTLKNPRPDMYLFLARAISAQDRCDEAVEMSENRVAGRIPGHVAYSLGRCYDVNGLWAGAVAAYERCDDYVAACADRLPIAREQLAAQAPESAAPESEAPELEAPTSAAASTGTPSPEAP